MSRSSESPFVGFFDQNSLSASSCYPCDLPIQSGIPSSVWHCGWVLQIVVADPSVNVEQCRAALMSLWCCSHEYSMSYQYHAMSNFFNRDNVGLTGFAAFYRVSSLEERTHAQQLMDYQVRHAAALM